MQANQYQVPKFITILEDKNYYKDIVLFVERLRLKYSNLVIVGLGGSFVAAKTILSILPGNGRVRFIYFLDESIIRENLKELKDDNTVFLFISKSGNTIEVLALYEIIKKYQFRNFIFLTNRNVEKNQLLKISKQENIECIHHEEDISGRFSFTSNVFFIPILFSNLNSTKLITGFCNPIKLLKTDELIKKSFNILFIYDIRFEFFSHWYNQLFAESLGKSGCDIMPIVNIGTRDQHSVLEQYLNNPHNKFITFISKKPSDLSLDIGVNSIINIDKNLSIQQIKNIEMQATMQSCNEVGLCYRHIELEYLDEYSISSLMMGFAMEILEIARKLNIDPFSQEMVEKRKSISLDKMKV